MIAIEQTKEKLREAIFEAGNINVEEFPAHNQICQNYTNEALNLLDQAEADYKQLEAENKRLREACKFAKSQIRKNAPKKALPIIRQALAESKEK